MIMMMIVQMMMIQVAVVVRQVVVAALVLVRKVLVRIVVRTVPGKCAVFFFNCVFVWISYECVLNFVHVICTFLLTPRIPQLLYTI